MGMCQSREAASASDGGRAAAGTTSTSAMAGAAAAAATGSGSSRTTAASVFNSGVVVGRGLPSARRMMLKRCPSESSCSHVTIIPEVTDEDDIVGVCGDNASRTSRTSQASSSHHTGTAGGGGGGSSSRTASLRGKLVKVPSSSSSSSNRGGKKKKKRSDLVVMAFSSPASGGAVTEATAAMTPLEDGDVDADNDEAAARRNPAVPTGTGIVSDTGTPVVEIVVEDDDDEDEEEDTSFDAAEEDDDDRAGAAGGTGSSSSSWRTPPELTAMTIFARRPADAPSDEEDYLADNNEEPGRLVLGKLQNARIRTPSSAALVAPPRSSATPMSALTNEFSVTSDGTTGAFVYPAPLEQRQAQLDEPAASIHPQTVSEFKRLELQNKLKQQQTKQQAKVKKYQDRYQDVQSYRKLWNEFQQLQKKEQKEREQQQQEEEEDEEEPEEQHQQQEPEGSKAGANEIAERSRSISAEPSKLQQLTEARDAAVSVIAAELREEPHKAAAVAVAGSNQQLQKKRKKTKRRFRGAKIFLPSLSSLSSAEKKRSKAAAARTTPVGRDNGSNKDNQQQQQVSKKVAEAKEGDEAVAPFTGGDAQTPPAAVGLTKRYVSTTAAADITSTRRKSKHASRSAKNKANRRSNSYDEQRGSRDRRSSSFDLHDSKNWYFDFQAVDFAYEGDHGVEANQCNLSLHSETSLDKQRRLFAEKRRQRKQKRKQKGPPLTSAPPLTQFLARHQSQVPADDVSEDLTQNRSYGGSYASYDYGPTRKASSSVQSAPAVSAQDYDLFGGGIGAIVGPTDMEVSFGASNEGGDDRQYHNSHADAGSCCMSDLGEDASFTGGSRYSYASNQSKGDYGVVRRRPSSSNTDIQTSREKLAWLEERVRAIQTQHHEEEREDEEKKETASADDSAAANDDDDDKNIDATAALEPVTGVSLNTGSSATTEPYPAFRGTGSEIINLDSLQDGMDGNASAAAHCAVDPPPNERFQVVALAQPDPAQPSPLLGFSLIDRFNGTEASTAGAGTTLSCTSSLVQGSSRPPKPPAAAAGASNVATSITQNVCEAKEHHLRPSSPHPNAYENDSMDPPGEQAVANASVDEDEDVFDRLMREAVTSSSSSVSSSSTQERQTQAPPDGRTRDENIPATGTMAPPSDPPGSEPVADFSLSNQSLAGSTSIPLSIAKVSSTNHSVAPSPLPASQLEGKFDGAASEGANRRNPTLHEKSRAADATGDTGDTTSAVENQVEEDDEDVPLIPKVPPASSRFTSMRSPLKDDDEAMSDEGTESRLRTPEKEGENSPSAIQEERNLNKNEDVDKGKVVSFSGSSSPLRGKSPKKCAWIADMSTEQFLLLSEENALKRAARLEHNETEDLENVLSLDDDDNEEGSIVEEKNPSASAGSKASDNDVSSTRTGESNGTDAVAAAPSSVSDSSLDLTDSLRLAETVQAQVHDVLTKYREGTSISTAASPHRAVGVDDDDDDVPDDERDIIMAMHD